MSRLNRGDCKGREGNESDIMYFLSGLCFFALDLPCRCQIVFYFQMNLSDLLLGKKKSKKDGVGCR